MGTKIFRLHNIKFVIIVSCFLKYEFAKGS